MVGVNKRRVSGSRIGACENDLLAIEDPLEIALDSGGSRRVLSVTMRTPGDDEDLLHGFLFAEGMIRSASEIARCEFQSISPKSAPVRVTAWLAPGTPTGAARHRAQTVTTSACGVCGTGSLDHLRIPKNLRLNDPIRVHAEWIHGLPDRMRDAQPTFASTGGLHAAAIFRGGGDLICSREDIGRHNALDKAIGACLRRGNFPAPAHVLCVSGRMSYEILQKALVARIPIIAGVGAPSSLAVMLANDFDVTLLGFVRGGSFNIYSGEQRIL